MFLRTCHAPVALGLAASATAFDPWLRFAAAGLVALLLVVGLATRVAGLCVGTAAAFALSSAAPWGQWMLAGHLGSCAGIALLGAGAYSVDARLHGRRVIHLQMRAPDRGNGH